MSPHATIKAWKCDERPARGAWTPGPYLCKCSGCGDTFIGEKRALVCADCAYKGCTCHPSDNPPDPCPGKHALSECQAEAHYVSLYEKPTPYEAEIIQHLMQECAEVTQRASKLAIFGRDEKQKGQDLNNAQRLGEEIGNLRAILDLALKLGLSDRLAEQEGYASKLKKLPKYLQSTPHEPRYS